MLTLYKFLKVWKPSQNSKCQKGDKNQVHLLGDRVQNLVTWVTCLVFVHPAFALTSVGFDSSLFGQCYNLLLWQLEPEMQLILWYCCKVLFLCVC